MILEQRESKEDFAATLRICFAATGVLGVDYISNPHQG